jgi:hypothetical protein
MPDSEGRSISSLVFGSEDEARAVAGAPPPPGGPVILREVSVHEIARDA